MNGGETVRASKKFVDDFMTVAKHYMLAEHGELEQAKSAARADLDGAIICYTDIANKIRQEMTA
jgi:hypothetical protein